MSDELVERVARAIDAASLEPVGDWREWVQEARAAIAAIDQSEVVEALEDALDEYEQHNGRILEGPHWSVNARAALAKHREKP